jgi:hypothetical protein
MDHSSFELTCECGKQIRTTALLSKCKHCGREIRIEWNTKAEFKRALWAMPTPREDTSGRRQRLEIMRFKKQAREEKAS